eukprot:CAMPEP_0202085572 /NCGR_PEP_ID=MMETSP0964-20121228/31132_1 /ASSEMBLY_ACC=CAM_ASM_000500 /TAXON_ID=4773 /ORGANISM="Schizochytrium aggregatum, Strain ATCC28209" /LENGTH=56 /DNA_ID=CAMNT_0048653407 /DNA_START=1 /DNA_END=167 /DNA_ORIENTATION=+
MDLPQRSTTVHKGFFLDPGRFRRALGDDVYSALRYYETAVEVVRPAGGAAAGGSAA